jgi:hypothetical protein
MKTWWEEVAGERSLLNQTVSDPFFGLCWNSWEAREDQKGYRVIVTGRDWMEQVDQYVSCLLLRGGE